VDAVGEDVRWVRGVLTPAVRISSVRAAGAW